MADDLSAVGEVVHEVIPWEEIGAEEGTGVVHIAPGAGEEDFDLGRDLGLAIVVPIDENGEYVDGFGWLTGRDARQVAADVSAIWMIEICCIGRTRINIDIHIVGDVAKNSYFV